MKIMICSSKHLYHLIPPVKVSLEQQGHEVTLPNCYDDPMLEERIKSEQPHNHAEFKRRMFAEQEQKIRSVDALLVMNYEKYGQQNYIGGSTFLEMFKAWELGKRIYLMNPVPEGMLYDEIVGMLPVVIDGDVSRIQ
jgi:hypothetical protein